MTSHFRPNTNGLDQPFLNGQSQAKNMPDVIVENAAKKEINVKG
jgi:hypothetical protein